MDCNHILPNYPTIPYIFGGLFDLCTLLSSGTITETDKVSPARPVWETSNDDDDDMCRLDDGDDFPVIGSVLDLTFLFKAFFYTLET